MKFDSKFEEKVWKASRKGYTEYHPSPLHFTSWRTYTPDFLLQTKRRTRIFVETKGYFTPADRGKMLLVKEQHRGFDFRFVFMNAKNKLSKKSKTTYAQWCDKHGFKWAEGCIPEAWYNE